jgi:uncharacterized protein (TIGR00730 family)
MSKHLAPNHVHTVTVFGSSRVHKGEPEYADAYRLGILLAERGWTLCNGGHDGTMEAAARGAKEAGGHTIGVSFSLYRAQQVNSWLDQEIVAETLFSRLEQLVTLGDAYIVLRGGIGTLLELCLVWNLTQSPEFAHKLVVVVGESWTRVIATLREELPMHPWEASAIEIVPSVEAAVERLDQHFQQADLSRSAAS